MNFIYIVNTTKVCAFIRFFLKKKIGIIAHDPIMAKHLSDETAAVEPADKTGIL